MSGKKRKLSPAAPSEAKRLTRPSAPTTDGDLPRAVKPSWRLAHLDTEHDKSWSWLTATPADLQEILGFLRSIETQTWAEILNAIHYGNRAGAHRSHKLVAVDQLCREAQDRLAELGLDTVDELFEFRVNSELRLWGRVREGVFYPIWRDPDHKVYPLGKN